MGVNIKLVAIVVSVLAVVVGRGDAATYVVGDSMGWTVPTGGAAAYANWASTHVFRIGDVLVFNFVTGVHDVATVTRAAYDGCSSSNPSSLVTQGPANVTLNSAGTSYFICTFGQHCNLGQKLAINVSGASPPMPTPTPAPTVTPRSAPAPPPSGGSMPAPAPPPSGGSTPAPAPARPPSGGSTPAPAPTPSGGMSPSPSPSSNPTPSPESTPSPAPSGGGGASPPSPPTAPGSPPGSSPPGQNGASPPGQNGNSPPAPSSAPTTATAISFVVFASIAMGLAI